MALQDIKTIILLMFENRSFDHMLGHLSFENLQPAANGLKPPPNQDQYANLYQGGLYYPFHRPTDEQLQSDLPHEYNFVATQLAIANGAPQMTGFVEAYADYTKAEPNRDCDPLCFYGSEQVPVTSFLARSFCTCDSWHCPLPTSTQPNRTVAFCGHSEIYQTKLQAIPAKDNIFSWLDKHNISWGVYHDGFTFFALYPDLWATAIFSGKFHDYERLATDLKNGTQPQVIIVEPSYQDAPHISPDHPNDNHPPLAVGWGEDFLRSTYQAATINPAVWASTLMVVYYDEHGGFYDHVPPPAFDNAAAGNALPPPPPSPPPPPDNGPVNSFGTLGPRVPAILISPWVAPASVDHNLYDHTSVLQLLAELYTPGVPYSDAVANRARQGIKSLSSALAIAATTAAPPAPPADPIFAKSLLGDNIATPPDNDMGRSLEDAALQMIAKAPAQVDRYFPLLNNWKAAVVQARPGTIPPLPPQKPQL